MFGKCNKLVLTICLCLSAVFPGLACIGTKVGGTNSQLPKKSLTLIIDKGQREELFGQLQKFADEHDLRLVLTKYEKTEHFFVDIRGDNILITVSDVPPDPTLVYILFYEINPQTPVDQEKIDELAAQLKSFLGEIPDVEITEEQ